MQRMSEIERLYYKAITTRLNTSARAHSADLQCHYPKEEEFKEWAREVDVDELDKERPDFSLDEAIVTSFADYRQGVEKELLGCFSYDGIQMEGVLKNIGSCHDGSKVGRLNEIDSLYVLGLRVDGNIDIEQDESGEFWRIFWKQNERKTELRPRNFRDKFADTYCEIVSRLCPPRGLEHGGYNSPLYSGIRYNGPAATSQFLTSDGCLLTWDVTPVFRLPRQRPVYQIVREKMQAIIRAFADRMIDTIDIHLIPDTADDVWRLSTALLEAEILRELPSYTPMKKALSFSKVLSGLLKKWAVENSDEHSLPRGDSLVDIVTGIDDYNSRRDSTQTAERLNREMRYAHIWIPPSKRSEYNEDKKSYISINTAAVKHILLSVALQYPAAFSAQENREMVFHLMEQVFQTLGDASKISAPHAFLPGYNIPHLSVLPSVTSEKLKLALVAKDQCRILLAETIARPTAELKRLGRVAEMRTQSGVRLLGMCCDEDKLYCVVWMGTSGASLTVYNINIEASGIKLLDMVSVEGVPLASCRPRADNQLHRVYVPAHDNGVKVFKCEDNLLVSARDPLRCLRCPIAIAVHSTDVILVCDADKKSVWLVDVLNDTLIRALETPSEVAGASPHDVVTLGNSVFVTFNQGNFTFSFVLFSDVSSRGRIPPLAPVSGNYDVRAATYGHSCFLVMAAGCDRMFVLDRKGSLCNTILLDTCWRMADMVNPGNKYEFAPDDEREYTPIPRRQRVELMDCTVRQSQIWLGYQDGPIAVMSPL